jgi:hypothetical protein
MEVQMLDPLMPLAASVVCVEGGLTSDESVALTAAALVIQGPLALAPALVAVERHRREDASPTPTPVPPPTKVGPLLVQVPDVLGLTKEAAAKQLEAVKLTPAYDYNDAIAVDDNKVIVQTPVASTVRVAEGTTVRLKIGKLKPDAPIPDDVKAIADVKQGVSELKADVDGKLERMSIAIEGLVAELKAARTAAEAAAKQKG